MKRSALYAALFAALFLLGVSGLYSMDWPSSTGRVTRNFGWNENGLPHLGVSFEGGGSFGAAETGELLFERREDDNASRLPSPLGSWAALDHGDGIISIYGRYSGASADAPPGNIERGFPLGEAGISGWSSREGFFFQLFDRKEKRWINPSLLIHIGPEAAQAANQGTRLLPPAIMAVRLRDSEGRIFNPYGIGTLSQGRYVVSVDAVSRTQEGSPLAPQRIICSVNGSESGELNFETYLARDGFLMVNRNGLVPVSRVYAPSPAYEIADVWFSRGQTTLEIITEDALGNLRNVVYRFQVN